MNSTRPLYHLDHVRLDYGTKKVLDIQSFEIARGSITGLIGPNGSGKTTLLKLLAFAAKPTSGKILYNGRIESCFSPAIRSKITLLTQKPYLLKRTVFDNIAYGLKIRKDLADLDRRIEKSLSLVGLDFGHFARRMWHELSGGEAQRVAMAARLILKPETLLLDEPVANVDAKSARLIRNASIRARDEWGTTLVIASHDLSWLFSVTDQQLSLRDGKLFATGLENMIPGPFEPQDLHHVTKRLSNGQALRLKPPEKPDQTAIIKGKKTCITLERQPEQDNLNQIWGQIVSMHLEKKQGLIMAKLSLEGLEFELSMTQDQIEAAHLFPGQKINVMFHADDVEWV